MVDNQGQLRFRVGPGTINPNSPAAGYQVNSLSGATVTGDAVTRIIAYWFGSNGYKAFLDKLNAQPPTRAIAADDNGGAAT